MLNLPRPQLLLSGRRHPLALVRREARQSPGRDRIGLPAKLPRGAAMVLSLSSALWPDTPLVVRLRCLLYRGRYYHFSCMPLLGSLEDPPSFLAVDPTYETNERRIPLKGSDDLRDLLLFNEVKGVHCPSVFEPNLEPLLVYNVPVRGYSA